MTIQEFLATHFILKLPTDRQFEAFKPLFGQPRFVAIFQFYVSQTTIDQHYASEFCCFFAQVFKHIQLQVDKQSQRHPKKWQGDMQRVKDSPKAVFSELSSIEPTSIPQALSPFDLFHIVLYCPLPFFDMGYVLASMSVSCDRELKFDSCACIRDDIMMYGHLSGVQIPSASPAKYTDTCKTPPPHDYVHVPFEIFREFFSDISIADLPRWCSTVRDGFLLMTYISPQYFYEFSDMFDDENPEFDLSNIFFVGNVTDEAQTESVEQEFDNLAEHCKTQ